MLCPCRKTLSSIYVQELQDMPMQLKIHGSDRVLTCSMSAQDIWARKYHELWEKLEKNTKDSFCKERHKIYAVKRHNSFCTALWRYCGIWPAWRKNPCAPFFSMMGMCKLCITQLAACFAHHHATKQVTSTGVKLLGVCNYLQLLQSRLVSPDPDWLPTVTAYAYLRWSSSTMVALLGFALIQLEGCV